MSDSYAFPGLWAENLVLPALKTKQVKFTGLIDKLDQPSDLAAVGTLVSKFLNGENQILRVVGHSVNPPVNWLPALDILSLNIALNGERRLVRIAILYIGHISD